MRISSEEIQAIVARQKAQKSAAAAARMHAAASKPVSLRKPVSLVKQPKR